MTWLLVDLLGQGVGSDGPTVAEGDAASGDETWRTTAVEHLSARLTPAALAAEAAYLRAHPGYERPYGWAWAAQLCVGLRTSPVHELRGLSDGAEPLLDAVFANVLAWLPRVAEPVRHGVHSNTAFGLRRLRRAADAVGRLDVVEAIDDAARRFYFDDVAWPFAYERSGHDFLSPGLVEAELMVEVLPRRERDAWLSGFLSELEPASRVLRAAEIRDGSDGQQSHLYGLGLSTAAALLRLRPALEAAAASGGELRMAALAAAIPELVPGLAAPGRRAAVEGDFMSSHWLATFAWELVVEERASEFR